ncbi:MAG: HTH-type transcriptional repressor KstR2 [Bacteroidota bacterium]|jgi:AcrR family transcriptional regulator
MEEKNLDIIDKALSVFMRKGIKSINMDDMSKELGISKKTLYLFVKDKEELVEKATDLFCQREIEAIKNISIEKVNAIDESLLIKKWVLSVIENVHPAVAFDLEKYYPSISKKMQDNRRKVVYKSIYNNIIKGQKEGLYRKDIIPEIVTRIYIGRMEMLLDPNVFPPQQFLMSDVYLEAFHYHIRGIASDKGIKILEQPKTKNKQKRKNNS